MQRSGRRRGRAGDAGMKSPVCLPARTKNTTGWISNTFWVFSIAVRDSLAPVSITSK